MLTIALHVRLLVVQALRAIFNVAADAAGEVPLASLTCHAYVASGRLIPVCLVRALAVDHVLP